MKDLVKEYNSLDMAMEWLLKAFKVTRLQGVSAGYSVFNQWFPPYFETTGYILETFVKYAKLKQKSEFLVYAKLVADWLLSVQLPCGGFMGGSGYKVNAANPAIFNTGQIIFSLLNAYKEFADNKYLESAIKVGDWLISMQEPNGN